MGRNDQSASHQVGDLSAIVLPDDMQAQVQASGTPCRGEHRPCVHVEHVRIYFDGGISAA